MVIARTAVTVPALAVVPRAHATASAVTTAPVTSVDTARAFERVPSLARRRLALARARIATSIIFVVSFARARLAIDVSERARASVLGTSEVRPRAPKSRRPRETSTRERRASRASRRRDGRGEFLRDARGRRRARRGGGRRRGRDERRESGRGGESGASGMVRSRRREEAGGGVGDARTRCGSMGGDAMIDRNDSARRRDENKNRRGRNSRDSACVAPAALALTEVVRETKREDVEPKVEFSSLTRHDGGVMEHSKAHPRMLKNAPACASGRRGGDFGNRGLNNAGRRERGLTMVFARCR